MLSTSVLSGHNERVQRAGITVVVVVITEDSEQGEIGWRCLTGREQERTRLGLEENEREGPFSKKERWRSLDETTGA